MIWKGLRNTSADLTRSFGIAQIWNQIRKLETGNYWGWADGPIYRTICNKYWNQQPKQKHVVPNPVCTAILDYVHTVSFSLAFYIVLRPQGIRKQMKTLRKRHRVSLRLCIVHTVSFSLGFYIVLRSQGIRKQMKTPKAMCTRCRFPKENDTVCT